MTIPETPSERRRRLREQLPSTYADHIEPPPGGRYQFSDEGTQTWVGPRRIRTLLRLIGRRQSCRQNLR
jgi:hypothetical protein